MAVTILRPDKLLLWEDRKEQIKQQIVVELERARFLNSLLAPSIGLVLTLFFTDKYFADNILAKILFGAVGTIVSLCVFVLRNECFTKIYDYIKKL